MVVSLFEYTKLETLLVAGDDECGREFLLGAAADRLSPHGLQFLNEDRPLTETASVPDQLSLRGLHLNGKLWAYKSWYADFFRTSTSRIHVANRIEIGCDILYHRSKSVSAQEAFRGIQRHSKVKLSMIFGRYLRCSSEPRIAITLGVTGLSIVSTLLGIRALLAFNHTAAAVHSAPAKWPSLSTIKRDVDRPKLLVFVHPLCPCTRATLDALEKVPALHSPGTPFPAITVLFSATKTSQTEVTALWKGAQELPGARVLWDYGQEAQRFGALTSGYVLLYNSAGELLFHGGVTGSRGHAGDNYGLEELLSSLESGRPAPRPSQVFGCALPLRNQTNPR